MSLEPATPAGRPALLRLDATAAGLLVAGGLLFFLMAPIRTESYYIDWISGLMIGVMVAVSEVILTLGHFRSRLSDAMITLRCRRGIPEGTQSVLALLAALLLSYGAMIVLFDPIWELRKTELFTFNTICSTLWTLWIVYLSALVWWAVRWQRVHGRAVRLRFSSQ